MTSQNDVAERDIFADEISSLPTTPLSSNGRHSDNYSLSSMQHTPSGWPDPDLTAQSPSSGDKDVCLVRSQAVPPGACTYGTTGYIATEDSVPPQNDLEEKLFHLKAWSVKTFKCTRQRLREAIWNGQRTVDPDLEKRIAELKQIQSLYREMLAHIRRISHHFTRQLAHQFSLSQLYSVISEVETNLCDEYTYNSQAQRKIYENGAALLAALTFFSNTLETQVNKAMEDTLQTVSRYETARVEYDAYANDLRQWESRFTNGASNGAASSKSSATSNTASPTQSDPLALSKLQAFRQKVEAQRVIFERLREDVNVKMSLLEENRCRVMHKQMVLFHNAMSSFFTGNQTTLIDTMNQFSISVKSPNELGLSWLEKMDPK